MVSVHLFQLWGNIYFVTFNQVFSNVCRAFLFPLLACEVFQETTPAKPRRFCDLTADLISDRVLPERFLRMDYRLLTQRLDYFDGA